MSYLIKSEILGLIQNKDMISGYFDLNDQLQPNGFDLQLDNVYEYGDSGYIGHMGEKRIPDYKPVPNVANLGYSYFLKQGAYAFDVMETIKMPLNVCALTIQRSSIMRCGCLTNTGFWESGYNGKGYSELIVHNPHGFSIKRGAKIVQMIFFKHNKETEGYSGSYQGEGVTKESINYLGKRLVAPIA